MKTLKFQIGEGYGLHARPAGVLVNMASGYNSNITVINKDGTRASAKGLFALLGLKVEGGDNVTVEIEGADEVKAAAAIENLFNNNFKASVDNIKKGADNFIKDDSNNFKMTNNIK